MEQMSSNLSLLVQGPQSGASWLCVTIPPHNLHSHHPPTLDRLPFIVRCSVLGELPRVNGLMRERRGGGLGAEGFNAVRAQV